MLRVAMENFPQMETPPKTAILRRGLQHSQTEQAGHQTPQVKKKSLHGQASGADVRSLRVLQVEGGAATRAHPLRRATLLHAARNRERKKGRIYIQKSRKRAS